MPWQDERRIDENGSALVCHIQERMSGALANYHESFASGVDIIILQADSIAVLQATDKSSRR